MNVNFDFEISYFITLKMLVILFLKVKFKCMHILEFQFTTCNFSSGMVKNLLNSGHNVSVWNRTTDKVRDFVEAGAKEALTPSDVIADSDITFSCVADPQAAKDLVFGNCGVLQEINTTKVRDKI